MAAFAEIQNFNRETLIHVVSAVIMTLVLYFLYYLTRRKIILLFSHESDRSKVRAFIMEKTAGFSIFGFIPFIFVITGISGSLRIIPGKWITPGSGYIIPLIILIILSFTFFSSKKKTLQEKFPQMRIRRWNFKCFFISATCWIIYLFGYEFLFRQYLWQVCFISYGLWIALTVNVLLYVIVHLDQGILVSIGAIPFGILLCVITYISGSFLYAFILHSCLAVSTEMFSIYNNPELNFIFNNDNRS